MTIVFTPAHFRTSVPDYINYDGEFSTEVVCYAYCENDYAGVTLKITPPGFNYPFNGNLTIAQAARLRDAHLEWAEHLTSAIGEAAEINTAIQDERERRDKITETQVSQYQNLVSDTDDLYGALRLAAAATLQSDGLKITSDEIDERVASFLEEAREEA